MPGQLQQVYPSSGPAFEYLVAERDGTVRVTLDDAETELTINSQGTREGWCRTPDGRSHHFASGWVGSALHLWLDGILFIFEPVERTRGSTRRQSTDGEDVFAPMPGTLVQVLVNVGDRVEAGERLFILESMKMELVIDATRGGVVKGISVAEGSLVDQGMRLLEFEEPVEDG